VTVAGESNGWAVTSLRPLHRGLTRLAVPAQTCALCAPQPQTVRAQLAVPRMPSGTASVRPCSGTWCSSTKWRARRRLSGSARASSPTAC